MAPAATPESNGSGPTGSDSEPVPVAAGNTPELDAVNPDRLTAPLYAGVPIGTGHLLEFAGEHLQSLGRIAHGYAQRAKADPSTQARACRAIAELASSGHGVFLLAQLAGQQGDHTTFKGIVGCHAAFMDSLKLATHEVMRAGRLAGRAAA